MSEIQFHETRMGRQFYEVTGPNLVREIHRLNDLLDLLLEMKEKQAPTEDRTDDRPGSA